MKNMISEHYSAFYELNKETELENPKLQRIKELIEEVIDIADKFENDAVAQYHAALVCGMISDENNKRELSYLNNALEKDPAHLPALIRRATIYYQNKEPMLALEDLMLSKSNLEKPLPEHCFCTLKVINEAVVVLEQNLLNNDILLQKVKAFNKFEFKDELMLKLEKTNVLNDKHAISIHQENYRNMKKDNKILIKIINQIDKRSSTVGLLDEITKKDELKKNKAEKNLGNKLKNSEENNEMEELRITPQKEKTKPNQFFTKNKEMPEINDLKNNQRERILSYLFPETKPTNSSSNSNKAVKNERTHKYINGGRDLIPFSRNN